MKLELQHSLRQGLEQRVNLEVVLAQKLELVLRLERSFDLWREGGEQDQQEMLKFAIEEVVSRIQRSPLADTIFLVLNQKPIKDRFLQATDAFVTRDQAKLHSEIQAAALILVYQAIAAETQMNVTQDQFQKAYFNPESVQNEINTLTEYLRMSQSANRDDSATVENISALQSSLTMVNQHRETINGYSTVVETAFCVLDKPATRGGVSVLQSVLTDMALQRRLDRVVSERVLTRFETKVTQSIRRSTPGEFENAVLNMIGEQALVTMGVLDQKLFQLQSANVDYSILEPDFKELGLSMNDELKRYGLTSKGRIFWNSWALRGRKPTVQTDDQIRLFIINHVRKEKDGILAAIDYPNLFAQLQETMNGAGNMRDKEKREQANLQIRKKIIEVLTDDQFFAAMKPLFRKWYPELQQFYSHTEDKEK